MKRIAFVAAAALLGTGCVSSSSTPPVPRGDVALYWQFRDFDGNVAGDFGNTSSGCGTAGVTDVDVQVWQGNARVLFQNFPCETGGVPVALASLPEGDYTFDVTAYRLADPVFYGTGSVSAMEGMTMTGDATLDIWDTVLPMTMYYKLNGAFTCSGVDNVYFRIWNGAQTTVIANTQLPCDAVSFGFTLPNNEPVGTYYVEWFQARTATPVSMYERCAFNVRHGGFPVVVNLLPAPDASCP